MPSERGTNSQGNSYAKPGGTNENPSSYRYDNQSGSKYGPGYHYQNDNGSTYHKNTSTGKATYTDPAGNKHVSYPDSK